MGLVVVARLFNAHLLPPLNTFAPMYLALPTCNFSFLTQVGSWTYQADVLRFVVRDEIDLGDFFDNQVRTPVTLRFYG